MLAPPHPSSGLQQDMKEWVVACPAQCYDVVFSSFAVHHLRWAVAPRSAACLAC